MIKISWSLAKNTAKVNKKKFSQEIILIKTLFFSRLHWFPVSRLMWCSLFTSPTGADAAVPAAISLINFQVSSFTCSYTKQWVGQLPNIHAIRVTLNHTAAVGEQKKKNPVHRDTSSKTRRERPVWISINQSCSEWHGSNKRTRL